MHSVIPAKGLDLSRTRERCCPRAGIQLCQPQIGGMFKGDFNRKATLAEYGFRLPSCIDNRPLRFEEWDAMRPQRVYVSATPGLGMMQTNSVLSEQVIRRPAPIAPPQTRIVSVPCRSAW